MVAPAGIIMKLNASTRFASECSNKSDMRDEHQIIGKAQSRVKIQ
jgi:hypothetical protein